MQPGLPLDPDGRLGLALAVVVDIALHGTAGPVGGGAVAERLGQSARGIEPLLQSLSRAGILASTRGRGGGYRLARARQDISAGEVARAMDPGVPLNESRPLVARVVAPVLADAAEAALLRLDRISLEALCRKAIEAGLSPAPPSRLTWAI
ncbi:MAG: Rrf2 family transcriptional regulator [Acetobacteraceae bacterium]